MLDIPGLYPLAASKHTTPPYNQKYPDIAKWPLGVGRNLPHPQTEKHWFVWIGIITLPKKKLQCIDTCFLQRKFKGGRAVLSYQLKNSSAYGWFTLL